MFGDMHNQLVHCVPQQTTSDCVQWWIKGGRKEIHVTILERIYSVTKYVYYYYISTHVVVSLNILGTKSLHKRHFQTSLPKGLRLVKTWPRSPRGIARVVAYMHQHCRLALYYWVLYYTVGLRFCFLLRFMSCFLWYIFVQCYIIKHRKQYFLSHHVKLFLAIALKIGLSSCNLYSHKVFSVNRTWITYSQWLWSVKFGTCGVLLENGMASVESSAKVSKTIQEHDQSELTGSAE